MPVEHCPNPLYAHQGAASVSFQTSHISTLSFLDAVAGVRRAIEDANLGILNEIAPRTRALDGLRRNRCVRLSLDAVTEFAGENRNDFADRAIAQRIGQEGANRVCQMSVE